MNKQTLIFVGILVSGAVVWRISERMSTDAISLAVGVFLGVMVAIPLCLLLMSKQRHQETPAKEPAASPAVVPQLVIVSQRIDKQIVVNQSEATEWQAWKISPDRIGTSNPLQQIEQDTAYPIEYK